MGLIEQLILLAKESIDEANQRGKRPPAAPAPEYTEDEIATLRQVRANRVVQARMDQEQARRDAEEQRAEQQRQYETQQRDGERQRQRQRQQQTVEAARVVHASGAVDPRRIARLVRHPGALREMIVLREVLDKPLALRPRR
ncbi:MAG: hypothetical protein H0W78_10960 [Planctomycetes bacterium]|jgi:cell division protein FtsN|nr:hypothetical protein [Planctomycetota bacterium]